MGYLFHFHLSRGCTLWHSYEEQGFGYPFHFTPIKSVHSLALYGEHAFWNSFSNYPYQEGVLSGIHMSNRHLGYLFQFPLSRGCTFWHPFEEQAFWENFFNSPYQEVVLRHSMRNRHFGIRFSIPPIKGLYSLSIYLGTCIFENLFKLSLSRGSTLWHSYKQQDFWDTFFNSPYQ